MKDYLSNDIVQFILKIVGIYAVWYITYELWLLPNGWIDEPLSMNIASISAGILNAMGESVIYYGRVVGLEGGAGIEIVDGCNGIAAIGLFLGFIYAYPGDWTPRILFSIVGILVIYLVNIARIVFLSYIQVYWPSIFDFSHDYSTTTIFYLVIFILWMIWANIGEFKTKTETPTLAAS
ncbi:MAG: archaeosortase/exosortase family protein [Balneolaceae bacterium]